MNPRSTLPSAGIAVSLAQVPFAGAPVTSASIGD